MEKMQTIYTENPKLGDPNSVAQSLEQTHAKIADLEAERAKFQVRLEDTWHLGGRVGEFSSPTLKILCLYIMFFSLPPSQSSFSLSPCLVSLPLFLPYSTSISIFLSLSLSQGWLKDAQENKLSVPLTSGKLSPTH